MTGVIVLIIVTTDKGITAGQTILDAITGQKAANTSLMNIQQLVTKDMHCFVKAYDGPSAIVPKS